jgi:hypothetical protein
MLTFESVAEFLQSRGVTAPIVSGYDDQEAIDLIVFLTPNGGPGEKRERVFEDCIVQALCRGDQNDPASAEGLADQVDKALMDAVYPVQIGGRHCVSIQQAGGPPQLVERDDARRYTLSATYVFDIAR